MSITDWIIIAVMMMLLHGAIDERIDFLVKQNLLIMDQIEVIKRK
jgi:hypothetical protein